MGTRNLTMVIDQEGETKVAQYGQWDGYPSGVGASILKFLKDKELFTKFKDNLSKVRFLDAEGKDKEFWESYDKNTPEWSSQPDNRTDEQKRWWSLYCSRDLDMEVLENIANSPDEEIIIVNREDTGKGDSWVEYCYVINLKENTLSIYEHLDTDILKSYDLNNLPSEETFISDLEGSDEESED